MEGASWRSPRPVGTGQALRLVLSGETLDAAGALRIGLVELVVPAGELRERTMSLARVVASKSPVAEQAAKAAIHAAAEMPMSAGLSYETELFVTCFGSDDRAEGVGAFLEKRPPVFRGR